MAVGALFEMSRKHNWARSHFTSSVNGDATRGWCKHGGCMKSAPQNEEEVKQVEQKLRTPQNLSNADAMKKHIAECHGAFVDAEFGGPNQPTFSEAVANPLYGAGALTNSERWVVLFAVCNLPATLADHPLFRFLTQLPDSFHRRSIPATLDDLAQKLVPRAVNFKKAERWCTLAFDIGTVQGRRYDLYRL